MLGLFWPSSDVSYLIALRWILLFHSMRQNMTFISKLSFLLGSSILIGTGISYAQNSTKEDVLAHTFPRLQDDVPQQLSQYKNKVILVVNTASYCGFTKQYEGLEALYAQYQSRGFVVLGFPSNDFGKQEPGNSKEIADFCYNTYGVKFPMFAKSSVQGDKVNPFYAQLIKATGVAPKWNFYKYLIDRNGQVLSAYASKVTPEDKTLIADIEKALGK